VMTPIKIISRSLYLIIASATLFHIAIKDNSRF
jgi:hypothetical protein